MSASTGELACTYAALILHDTGLTISADNISSILKASNIEVEPYWPSIFASFLQNQNISELLRNVGGSSAGAAPAGGASEGASAAAPVEEEKAESSSESEADMGLGLFG